MSSVRRPHRPRHVRPCLAAFAYAALKVGAPAPDFSAPAYLAGEPFTFKLADAPSGAGGGILPGRAHARLQRRGAPLLRGHRSVLSAHATVIGVTRGQYQRAGRLLQETEHWRRQFPVALTRGQDRQVRRPADAQARLVRPHVLRDRARRQDRPRLLRHESQRASGRPRRGEGTQALIACGEAGRRSGASEAVCNSASGGADGDGTSSASAAAGWYAHRRDCRRCTHGCPVLRCQLAGVQAQVQNWHDCWKAR